MEYLIVDLDATDSSKRYIIIDFDKRKTSGWRSIKEVTEVCKSPTTISYKNIEECLSNVNEIAVICLAKKITQEYINTNYPELLI